MTLIENNRVASGEIELESIPGRKMRDVLVENVRRLVDEHNMNAIVNRPDAFDVAMGFRELE